MAKKYIKSYSNYVLKTKHQNTNDGTIYERDITTIGGRNQFAKGQVPIYQTGNFVITTNNDNSVYVKTSKNDWQMNDEGEVWTLNTLQHYNKDEKSSYDKKITIKKDYYDLRDFAYYGSCSELMRVSIDNIIKNYPGELFVPYETIYVSNNGDGVQYTEEAAISQFGENGYTIERKGIKGYYTSMENRKYRIIKDTCGNDITINSVSLIDDLTEDEKEALENGIPYTREFKYLTNRYGYLKEEKSLSLIDNPFDINMHYKFVPDKENPLRYFANGGINNYTGYLKLDENDNISIDGEWKLDKDHEYSLTIDDIIFDGIGESEDKTELFDVNGDGCPNNSCAVQVLLTLMCHDITERTSECTIDCIDPGKYIGRMNIGFRKKDYTFKTIPGLLRNEDGTPKEVCCDGNLVFNSGGGEGKYTDVDGSKKDTEIISYAEDKPKFNLVVYMFMGNNNEIKYLVEDLDKGGNIIFNYDNQEKECAYNSVSATANFEGTFKWDSFVARIRPNRDIIENYFKSLDSFERILLNRESDPLYTASFELISDNDYGMYTYTKQFTFPTTYGGYNLGSNNQSFENYLRGLSEVGEYYDSLFTDNIWRSMTHEAIKNFDWTYTRHFADGEEEPHIEAGTKIQKVTRLYGREFDEVKSYIDSINDLNTITYDNINNIPDYFFTDKLEEYGWDVKLIHPLELSEFVGNHDNVPVDIHKQFPKKYDEQGNEICTCKAEKLNYFYDDTVGEKYYTNRNKITIKRVFKQKDVSVVPYSSHNITSLRSGVKKGDNSYYNKCGDIIKIYSDNNEFTSSDVNNEFLKRLVINSPYIWKHKGTIEGIEMLLSLFGLKSKNRVYTDEKYFINKHGSNGADDVNNLSTNISLISGCSNNNSFNISLTAEKGNCLSLTDEGVDYYRNYIYDKGKIYNLYDYDIKEYTLFTTREEDEWLPSKNMYKYDWVNSTKLVDYGTNNGTYEPYQGLPVSYRNVVDIEGKKKRFLYPHFNSYERYDGNPYYQMNGGWIQKKPFMFDNNNNIIPTNLSCKCENDTITDSKDNELFTETVKNIKCVGNLQELLSNPSLINGSGDICQVTDLSGRYAIIDGYVYPILTELTEEEGTGNMYLYANIQNKSLSIGNVLFTDYVIISNPYFDNNKQRIDLNDDSYNNKSIKIYILKDSNGNYDIDIYSKDTSISTFTVFENGKYMEGDNYTNYFRINNADYYNELSVLGWQQLKDDEYEYYRMNSLTDYREGNNPHTGHMRYDNGHEYLTYFKNIFKYVNENDYIDYRQYDENDFQYAEDILSLGFSNLIDDDSCEKNYDKYLREDNKCHFFGTVLSKIDENCNEARYGLSCFKKRTPSNSSMYDKVDGNCILKPDSYKITDIFRKDIIEDSDGNLSITPLSYGKIYQNIGESGDEPTDDAIDRITDQIVNTKRMEIEFYIKNKQEYSKEWLEEVKYIDSVILPYLSQMIPSTVIWGVKYTTRDSEDWGNSDITC